jgi:glucose/arabinose dehydrogenase
VLAGVAALGMPAAGAPPGVKVPAGFRVETFASGLTQPTAMAYGPDGRIYVTQTGGSLVAIRRGTTHPQVLARGLRTPLGLAWRGRSVFVSEQGRLERLTLRNGRLAARRVVVKGLPFGQHQQDNVVLGPNGRLYWGSGSTCDVCRERDPRSAAVLSLRPNGRDLRVVARGLRNPYGLAFQPVTGRLYASVNGADDLGKRTDPSRPRWWSSSAEAPSTAGRVAGSTRGLYG